MHDQRYVGEMSQETPTERLRSDDACRLGTFRPFLIEESYAVSFAILRVYLPKMIPESAARRVACLAGHISRQEERGQDATPLIQQVDINLRFSSLWSELSMRIPAEISSLYTLDMCCMCRSVRPSPPCSTQGHAHLPTSSLLDQQHLRHVPFAAHFCLLPLGAGFESIV